jgi:ParB-like chromosome segregation protein Spo0J
MSDEELAELAADIKAHGMHMPIVLWRDNSEEPNGAEGPFPIYLLDGQNRLAALKLLGISDPYDAKQGGLVVTTVRILNAKKRVSYMGGRRPAYVWETGCDPYAFHKSMNVYRRHFTTQQRRWEIEREILNDKRANSAEIGRRVGADEKTVTAVRSEMSVQFPEIPENEHKPAARAEDVARSNPNATVREIAERAGVSVGTAAKARKQAAEPASSQQKATNPPAASKAAQARVDGFMGVALSLAHALEVARPETIALIVEDIAGRPDVRRQIKALRDGLDRLLVDAVDAKEKAA